MSHAIVGMKCADGSRYVPEMPNVSLGDSRSAMTAYCCRATEHPVRWCYRGFGRASEADEPWARDDPAAKPAVADNPSATESVPTEDAGEASPLDELGWTVGQWIDKGEVSTIRTTCSWTTNHKFLTRSFSVQEDGEVILSGTQVIGWDPTAKRIRSWTFDSEGGFGEGRWMRDGNRWNVKTSHVLANGEGAAAVNVITYVDRDTFRWQSTCRKIGGRLLPAIPEVTVVRQKSEATEKKDK